MDRVLPDTVKHPGRPGRAGQQDGRVAGLLLGRSADLDRGRAGDVRAEIVTAFPPAMLPVAGLSITPDGAVGSVPAVVLAAMPGLPSEENAVTVVPDWTVLAVTPEVVTMPCTVIAGSDAPAANGVAPSVQVIVSRTGPRRSSPSRRPRPG